MNKKSYSLAAIIGLSSLIGINNPANAQPSSYQETCKSAVYNLKIGTEQPGAPLFTVKLTLDSSNNNGYCIVKGFGKITQAVYPPLDIKTNLEGVYTIAPFIIHDIHPISFNLTGFPSVQFPKHGGLGPVIPPNVKLNINLSGYESKATYEYRTSPEQSWKTVKDVPVKIVSDTKAE